MIKEIIITLSEENQKKLEFLNKRLKKKSYEDQIKELININFRLLRFGSRCQECDKRYKEAYNIF